MSDSLDLLDGVRAAPGEEFLHWLVRHLSRTLGCEWAFVWERCGERWERARVVAAGRRGGAAPIELEAPIAGSPCEEVGRGPPVVFASGLQRRFPSCEPLRELGADSYLGLALEDAAGRPLGHLTLLDSRPLLDEARWLAALEGFRTRAAGELASRRAVRELETVLAASRGPTSADTMRALASGLARALHARFGFICELVPGRPGRVRMLALSSDGRDLPLTEYELADTPCSTVYERALLLEPDGVQELYPRDVALREMGARAFLGVRLDDSDGRPMGHVGVTHDSPLDPRLASLPILKIIVLRAAAELARRRAEEEKLVVERERFEAQKLESLGVLAGGIAHDFNNLLVGVLGHASLALRGLDENAPLRSHLASVEGAARRAADLASQLLACAGCGGFDPQPVDLSELVQETGRLVESGLPRRIDLRLELPRGLPAVRVDAVQIRRALMNLVANGVEAIGESGGTVRVATGSVTADRAIRGQDGGPPLREGDCVFLEVTDTGCGLDDATRERMFDPFFTTKEAGRGLGLAAVQGIVRRHGGALVVTSELGRGSSFRLILPACSEPAARPRTPVPRGLAAPGGGLVLVVDDEELVRSTTARMLDRLGFRAITAPDGRSGVRALVEHGAAVRLVLLDMSMPGLSGEETFAELRQARLDARVVLVSGYDRGEATRRLRDAGYSGFLQKPFGMNELERCVREALDRTSETVAAG